MKNVILSALGVLLSFVILWTIIDSDVRDRLGALGSVGRTLVNADQAQLPLIECGGMALRADHNRAVITRAADMIIAVGSNTGVFMRIAEYAAEADHECPLLDEVLDLAVCKTSESDYVLALAEAACRVETAEQEAVWRAHFDEIAATAEYPDVETALAAREAS